MINQTKQNKEEKKTMKRYTAKQIWMQNFEKEAIERKAYLPGKVDWSSAEYFYRCGMRSDQAVNGIILSRGIIQ